MIFQVVEVKGMTVVRNSKYSNLNIIQQAVIVLSYYLQICALAEFWSPDATTTPSIIVGHNAYWYIISPFEEGKYHPYARVIYSDLQNGICVLVLVLVLAEVFNPLYVDLNPICHLLALLGAHHILHISRIRVNDLTVNEFYSFYCFVVVFCCSFIDVYFVCDGISLTCKSNVRKWKKELLCQRLVRQNRIYFVVITERYLIFLSSGRLNKNNGTSSCLEIVASFGICTVHFYLVLVTFPLQKPNNFLSTLFLHTVIVQGHLSPPHTTVGKIIFLYILIFVQN
jgi:hypothetical protein